MKKQDIKKLQRMIALTLSLVGGLYSIAWAAPAATALPTGEQDMKNATVTRDTTTSPTNPVMTIEQTKGQNRAFISWDTFNIGKDATVNVKQYSGADLLVNAVRGNNMSEIAGKLNATGNVALINPNGVIFMDGAQVNVGGLGVYATGYDASKGIINSGNEGSIEIQSGAVINVGVSAALANLSALNIAPSDYAIAIDSSGEDGYTNRIHLVAEGNVEIKGGSTIKARDYTYVGDSASVGAEGFNVGVGAVGMGGKIYIRSDRDADDYGSVIITHGENSSKPVMQSVNGVSIYTNAAQVDGDGDTTNGINAAVSRTESGDGATITYYTKHDYKNGPSYEIDGSSYTDGTSVSVEGPGVTADKLSSSSADNKITTSYGGNGATTITTSLLVNNIDQLQDIEDGTHGNLDGRYVLGRDINATNDEHSYIDDGILYKMTDGKLTKWSTKDGVAITGTKSGGDLKKTVNGTTIGYSKDENKSTTTLTGGTILSNSNGTVGAENTQWSTTKGVSTVTDKTAGSTYTIQSDKKSVVDQDGLTSNTAAKTVTDKDNTYTADIGGHTVTHTSDNSVTDTNTHTVTKPAGTSDTGYTATVTDGSATAAGTSGTIAINDITYQVTGGKVGDTVTYGGSSVNTGKNTVTAGGVTTAVTENGTGTDGVKAGTIASDRVTVNGTTTTVTDGTTSYQITTGTDAVTYTKGTTSASISGTEVITGEVSADTSADKVIKGDTTAVITSDTAGSVTYGGRDYAVADGAVSMTDSKTGETVTVTGEDATKVLNIFSAAKTDLSNAQAIYGDYTTDAAKAQSLTKTLDGAIETLKEVTEKSTAEETVLSSFDKAAAQLKSDTALFGAASTALSNADTALTQYNALQKEISNNTKLEPALKQAYDEFQSSRLDDTTINNIHSDKWDDGKGFNPIGSSDAPFTGKLDGFSGETVFGLYNLTINRPDEDNVGLISVAGASGHAAALSDIHLYSTAITGNKNVGTVAGTLQQGSSLSWSGTAGTVKGTESLGGLVGLVDGSSIWDSSSSATVEGGNKAGGIAGTLQNGGTLTDVRNFGNVSGKEDVGGIAGYVEGGTITGSGSAIYNYANTYNTGTVTGTTNTGGIVGHAKGIYMYGVFNTNEDTPLSKKSQFIIDGDNKVIQHGDGTTGDKDKTITDASLKSSYGKVTGGTNTGGLVGYLEDAPNYSRTVTNINISSTTKTNADGTTTKEAVKDATIKNNVIDTSYNAGNITGTGENTGGLVGLMTGGTLSNVYNADNNTVLRQDVTLPEAITSFSKTGSDGKTYAYSTATAADCADQTMTQYYSFFTVDDNGSRTYYYFIPAATESGTTQKGAGGIYVTADGTEVSSSSLPSTSKRYYFNRTFNKDASVTGTGANTGGLVGSMTTTAGTTATKYSAGSVIDSAYNAGTITGSDTTTTGALVGSKDDASLLNDSFYVTGTDAANGNTYSNVNQAVGLSSSQTQNMADTAGLDATGSKKKYYVSDGSKRGNFPGVQQKTDTDKDSSGKTTATYYEYTSGTKGSFYTDGTGSIDSISHIYPITTTGTTDSAGKTTYTSTRSTTAAYTKQADGTFQDVSGNTYTATYDTATRQIVLTPVSSSSSTAAAVVLNAVLAARTANETWTIYEDQTRPLLTAFLNKASLSRSFSYDGTTHNLKTDDVANLYGRADFDGDAGKDVQLSNYQLSSNGVSSEYTYDNTSIWSPQHGYFMDPESTLVINPVDMSANIYGSRVYGDIFNTRGYYVCVPYKEGSDQKYSFYKPADNGSDSYTLLEGDALQKLFGTETPSEDSLLKIAEQKGFYVLELNGFINGEGANNLGSLIRGLVTTLSNTGADATKGNDLQHLFSNVSADTYLDAGVYNVTNKQITGLTATNQNYTINYGGTLTVKQAELYYTYDGSRTYGLQNTDTSATHTYSLVGVDSGTADSDGKYTSTHGFLKYWDLDSSTITIKNDDGTETTIDNPYKNFFKKNGNSYEINQDNIGVTGYTAEKTTTTTDVTTGTSTTVTSKDDTKSASLDDIYANMTGTVNTDSINKPGEDSTTTSKVIGSYGDGAVSDDMYTHVLVDKDGNPIGYKVTSFASTNKDAGGTIQLYFKTSSDTTDAADKNIQAAVNKFNQNYKLVWKEGGTYDKEYTIGNPTSSTGTTADDAGIKTTARGLTVNDSTLTINPVNLTVEVTGKREYGHTMGTDYKVSKEDDRTAVAADGNGTVNTAGLTNETYNINLDGLKNGDGKTILDDTAVKNLLGGIDAGDSADDRISRYTSVKQSGNLATDISYQGEKVYAYDLTKKSGNSDKTGSQITVTGKTGTEANHYDLLAAGNYDYTLQDGTHTLTIDRHDLNLNITAERQYGDISNQQVVSDYKSDAKASGTVPSYATGITVDGENGLQNGETIDFTGSKVDLSQDFYKADVGEYKHDWYNDDTGNGTAGITNIHLQPGTGSGFDAKNYNIHYRTTYTIDKADLYYTYDGERDYGEDNAAAAHTYTIVGKDNDSSKESVRGYLKSWDSGVLSDGNSLNKDLLKVTNEESGAYTMAGVAIQDADTASEDSAANVSEPATSTSIGKDSGYSHVIVDADGHILSYTLTALGTKIAGKDSTGTLAKNYNLIWKQGGSSHQLDKVHTASNTASAIDGNGVLRAATDTASKITVKNSSFKIDPLALTVTVTGQRDYGDTMTTNYKTDGTAGKDAYNIALTGSFANGETAGSVLNEDNVKKMLASLENDEIKGDGAATRENSNGKAGKISRYTDVKRKEDNKSQIDSYSLNVGSADTSSTITLASDVQKDASGKVTSIKHADSKEHGFNVLNNNNYDYVVSEGSHRLTINPVDLTVNVKGESTYGKADTTYTVTSTGAKTKNGETIVAGSETKSNLAANAAAGSYTADAWTDKTGAATSKAPTQSGKYLNTAALRAGQSSDAGTAADKGIYQVQLAAGENTDGSGLSTFSANNYNITYQTTQVVYPEKLTIAIGGTKVYGSQPTGLTADNMTITSGELAYGDSLSGLTVADNMDQLTDTGTYRHNWSIYAGGSVPAESYTYTDADGQTHAGDSTTKSWITGVSADNKTFDFNNYDVDFQSTYEVTKRPLQLDVTSTSVYGDRGYTYTAQALTPDSGVEEGLISGQQFNPTDIKVSDDIDEKTDAGTYTHRADGTSYSDTADHGYQGITAIEPDSLKDAGDTGFKSSNYAITLHQGTHVVEKRTVRATVSGSQVYGESAPTKGEAYQVAFDMAGGTGVNAHEGLVGGQSIANSQVTVQNSVGETNDVGTYTTTQSDVGAPIAYGNNPERVEGKDQGIDGLVVSDSTGTNAFKNNNYNLVLERGSYTVTKRPVTFLTTGSRTYGEENDKVGDYTIKQLNTADGEGLTGRNAGTVTEDKAAVINKTDALTDAGSYGTESDSAQVLDIDDSVQEILGDDYKNYTITYQDKFTINPRTVHVTIAGESTYGDVARTAGTDYKTIDFEQAGADGVAPKEGLVSGQTIDESQVTVQTDGIDEKTDAGTYHLSQEGGQPGISGITVTDGNGFKNNNYRIVMDDDSTYTIDKRPLTITIRGEKTYGDPTSFSGGNYSVSQSGLQNQETIDFGDARVLHSADTDDPFSEAGQYSSRDGKGILGFDDSTLHGDGFKLGNYALTYDTDFVIHKRPVDVYMESRRTSGSPSSLRMDEPMTMRNVPKEHQGRFLSDMEVIDTSPQVIAAGDYPGFDGKGYLDLYFAGDIYRNYDIHRHTVYHILPDRMVKLSIYNAVQPVRRPILDVMYFKVNGSEGINRWGGTENLSYGGEIILNKDVTSSIPAKPKITGKGDFPQVPGQEFPKEEVTQAVPVVYTDGRKQDVRGRYYLAYENDNVAMYPAEDAVSAPLPKEASVSRENRRTLRIPWQGGEGEYHVAYADGIVQIYPENETAYRLVQAKGKDEQLLLERSLTSAVRELGVQLEGIDAIYIYTK